MTSTKGMALAIAVFAAIVLGYFLLTHKSAPAATSDAAPAPGFFSPNDASTSAAVSSTPPPLPDGYAAYRNTTYGFSLAYPAELKIATFDEGGGASTVTFQNVGKAEGFQVFIVPYTAQQVSTARFKRDEPSGVMQDPQNLSIDGVPATMFFSTNVSLGATREVWFIHGGYLFEVTAPRPLDSWLAGIMQTWRFL